MPFDRAGFQERPERPPPRHDKVVVALILIVSFSALVTPLSVEAFVDAVRFVLGK